MAEQTPESQNPGSEEETVHHQSNREKREIGVAKMQLNLTPMIDVIFLLLIYFVVTASFAANEAVLVTNLPYGGSSSKTDIPDMPLKIHLKSVSSTGVQIAVAGQRVASFSQLAEVLISKQDNPNLGRSGTFAQDDPVKIQPKGDVRWQHVVNAFNAAVKARYTNVALTAPG
jgi:biopolymer transport protein ExbD